MSIAREIAIDEILQRVSRGESTEEDALVLKQIINTLTAELLLTRARERLENTAITERIEKSYGLSH